MCAGTLGKGATWLVDTTKGAVEKTGEGLKGAYEKTGEGLRTVGAQASELTSKATSGISEATSNIGVSFGGENAASDQEAKLGGLPPPQPVGRRGSRGGLQGEEEDDHRRETLHSLLDGQPYLGNDVDAYFGRTFIAVCDDKWVK